MVQAFQFAFLCRICIRNTNRVHETGCYSEAIKRLRGDVLQSTIDILMSWLDGSNVKKKKKPFEPRYQFRHHDFRLQLRQFGKALYSVFRSLLSTSLDYDHQSVDLPDLQWGSVNCLKSCQLTRTNSNAARTNQIIKIKIESVRVGWICGSGFKFRKYVLEKQSITVSK